MANQNQLAHPCATTTPAAERVSGMKDLMTEILSRVPAKPVTRFKLVSKKWCSLISEPMFVQSHSERNNLSSGIILFQPSGWYDFISLSDDQSEEPDVTFLDQFDYKVLQSCSGLLLCRKSYRLYGDNSNDEWAHNLCVCNPTTKQHRPIPPPDATSRLGWPVSGLGFAFDPSVSPFYKVVCIQYGCVGDKISYQVEVYSSENHQWRQVLKLDELELTADFKGNDGTSPHYGIHWVGDQPFQFDLVSDHLVPIEKLPPAHEVVGASVEPSATALRTDAYTCLVSYTNDKLYVTELNRDISKWVVMYSLDLCDLKSVYPEIFGPWYDEEGREKSYIISVIDVVRQFPDKDPVIVLAIPDRIISYNFIKKTVKTLYDFPVPEYFVRFLVIAFPFTVTLSSV